MAETDSLKEAGPKQHVFTYKAAMPDSDRVKTTAQLTDGSDSWASPNSFSARQLWDWMPVDIFVQTFGTANAVEGLSDLTSSGVRLSEYTQPASLMSGKTAPATCEWVVCSQAGQVHHCIDCLVQSFKTSAC